MLANIYLLLFYIFRYFFNIFEFKEGKFHFSKVIVRLQRKVKVINECLENLNKFCQNMILNLHPDEKYGTINNSRQKVK